MLNNGELCRCNNCGGLFKDTNPQVDAIKFENTINLPLLESKEEEVNGKKEFFQSCPVCQTDEYLSDITDTEDLTEEEKEKYTIWK